MILVIFAFLLKPNRVNKKNHRAKYDGDIETEDGGQKFVEN